jgi:hypothetical protein
MALDGHHPDHDSAMYLGIDKEILTGGAIIELFDLTLISFGSGRWTFGG